MQRELTDGTGVHSIPETRHNTSNNHMRNRVRRGLERPTNTKYKTSDQYRHAATELLSEDEGEDGTEEATDLVDGDDGALKGRAAVGALVGVDLGELGCEG